MQVQANATVISSLEDQVTDLRSQLVRKMRAITASMRTVKRHNSSTLTMQRLASADESMTLRASTHLAPAPQPSPPDTDAAASEGSDNATSPPVFGFSNNADSASSSLPRPFSPPAPSHQPIAKETLTLGAGRGKLPLLPEDAIALPSPTPHPCAIDIFSPLHPSQASLRLTLGDEAKDHDNQDDNDDEENEDENGEGQHDDVALDILATPNSNRSRDTVGSGTSSASNGQSNGPLLGDGPRASSSTSTSSSTASSADPSAPSGEAGGGSGRRMIKHATFSLNAGEGGSRSSLRPPSDGTGKSSNSSLVNRGAGGLAALGKDLDDEESIMELKHKVRRSEGMCAQTYGAQT